MCAINPRAQIRPVAPIAGPYRMRLNESRLHGRYFRGLLGAGLRHFAHVPFSYPANSSIGLMIEGSSFPGFLCWVEIGKGRARLQHAHPSMNQRLGNCENRGRSEALFYSLRYKNHSLALSGRRAILTPACCVAGHHGRAANGDYIRQSPPLALPMPSIQVDAVDLRFVLGGSEVSSLTPALIGGANASVGSMD